MLYCRSIFNTINFNMCGLVMCRTMPLVNIWPWVKSPTFWSKKIRQYCYSYGVIVYMWNMVVMLLKKACVRCSGMKYILSFKDPRILSTLIILFFRFNILFNNALKMHNKRVISFAQNGTSKVTIIYLLSPRAFKVPNRGTK